MSRALYTAISGLAGNQTWLDVIGDNIANANTPGFKASSVVFQDILSQTISTGMAPNSTMGGVNPIQVGLGVSIGSITPSFLQGSIQTTGRATDLAIQGDGFFVVANGSDLYYTRAGAFTLDANGNLVEMATGFKVQGTFGDIQINLGEQGLATPTSVARFRGNLDHSAPDGSTFDATFTVRDSVGATHTMLVTFTKNFAGAPGQWDFEVTTSDATIASIAGGTGSIVFDETGVITSGDFADIDIDYAPETGVTTPQTVTLDFGTADNGTPMTSVAGASDVTLAEQDGLAAGALQTFAIGADGTITGFYSNGTTQSLGVVQIATFNNPSGLLRVGQNHYEQSFSSGEPSVGNPGVGGRGVLAPGSLEASNVDLAKEFTAMILAQTGFQANARSIQTQDELLRELVNLTR